MEEQTIIRNSELPENHIIFVAGEINMDIAVGVCQQLLEVDIAAKQEGIKIPITLIINSVGGDLMAAWQICDIMDFIDCPVYTTGVGQVASAALIILMNGEIGHRVVSDRTSIMSHRYSWGTTGKHNDLISIQDEFRNTHNRMIKHYIECTGLNQKQIEEKLLCEHDVWLTSQQAKALKIVDKVITSKKTKMVRGTKNARKARTNKK